jgi:PKD repeat protein
MRVCRGRSVLGLVAAVAAVAVSAVGASTASAVLQMLPDGQTLSYQPMRSPATHASALASVGPFDAVFGNMDYNGGAVMPSSTNYLVFWSPKGLEPYGEGARREDASGSEPEYVSGLERYFRDLAHDSGGNQNTDSVSTQYNDLTGASAKYAVTFGGELVDTDPYPKSECPVAKPVIECMSDAQLQQELEKFTTARGLAHDLSHEYFLLTPPHVEDCFTNNASEAPPFGGCSAGIVPEELAGYCAYHGNTTIAPMLLYAFDPFEVGQEGCDEGIHPNGPSDAALEGGLSHEHNESITDPVPNDAWTNGAGPNHGFEIGDQCVGENGAPLGTAPNGAPYNQVINGHFYWYQEEWSNQGHTCLQRYTRSSEPPTARFSVTAGKGLTMTFDADESHASGGVAGYSWQFNDAFGVETIETTTPKITHTFPAAGAYSIGLAVFGHDGLSAGNGAIVTTGHSGFTPGFTASPTSPDPGQTVTFSALTNVSRDPVINYLWEFGDGSTGSGPQPTHAYASAGTYTVKAVLFSGVGSAFPGAGAGPVVTQRITVRQ